MTTEEIIQVLILGAKANKLLPDTARPKALRAIDYGFIHTAAEVRHQEPTRMRPHVSKNAVGLRDAEIGRASCRERV